ncbi:MULTISPECIES: type I-C CRISPR-associated protein Cas5c [Oceanobacillus]|uniref:pre-crRNA processing endonuclease n=1 Tax=Oceanobacillus indicireducens TaxID=1004261 RepID=A0A918D2Q7_9BACI|nr:MULTISPECIES: type I-C CRISPR-associated protein Cas5c [Oceanobacillus]GGN60176.1 type I-C CRISPR-associated protein Cas5 [Oceanobacillus indicireducens]
MRNQIEFVVHGKYALFTDPVTRIGGEKFTYQIPTYQALKGIVESVYWKPTLTWYIDEVRVMNPIQTEVKGVRPIKYQSNSNDLMYYTYLREPVYQVRAHFEFNENRPDLAYDRNEHKHHNIAKRAVKKGGRRDVFLGTRECQGYVEDCAFGEGESFYDDYGEVSFGPMFHGFTYPDEGDQETLQARIWVPTMKNGIIRFKRPEECEIIRDVRKGSMKQFTKGENFTDVDQEYEEMFKEV